VLAFDNNNSGRVEAGEDQKFLTTFQPNISFAQRGGYVDSHVVIEGDGSDLHFDGLARIVHSTVQGTGDYTAEFALPLNSGDRQDIAAKLTDPIRFNLLLVTRCCEQNALEFGGLFDFDLQDSRGWGVIRLESGQAPLDPPQKLSGTVAFITREFGAGRQIYAMNADGTNRRQLTSGNRVVSDPSLSPDGQMLVYTAALPDRPETQEIFTTSTRVAYPQQLTNNSQVESNPVFSPNGQTIAFVREGNLWVMNARGGNQKQLTNAGADGEPAWTPDGRIVFHTGRFGGSLQIAVMNADGSNITQLTRSEKSSLSPQVSSDGQWVTFFRYDGAGAFYEFGNSLFQPWNIYRIRVNGTDEQRLTDDGMVNFVPTFSPDGQGIFYQKLLDPNSFYSVLHYLDLKSGASRRVLDAVSRVEAFDWR
jgi:Tol biopolymer transport system component